MASLFEKLSSLSDFDRVFGGGVNAGGFGTGEATPLNSAKTFDDEVRERLRTMRAARGAAPSAGATAPTFSPEVGAAAGEAAEAATESRGVLSRVGGALRSVGRFARGVGRAALGPIGAGIGLAIHSSEAGAGSDIVPGLERDEAAMRRLDQLDKEGKARLEESNRRVKAAIEKSRAIGAAPPPPKPATPPRLPSNFAGIQDFLSDLLQFGNAKSLENQAAAQRAAETTALGKILEKRLEPKVINVEGLTGKAAIFGDRIFRMDEKGEVKVQPLPGTARGIRPSTAEAHRAAQAKVDASHNKAATRLQVNARLVELGYPELP